MEGDPKYLASQDIPDFPYASYAESLGLRGFRADRGDRLAEVWDRALRADRPALVEVACDPEVPPLPPHITLAQAKAFAEAVLKGDPSAGPLVRRTLGQTLGSFVRGE